MAIKNSSNFHCVLTGHPIKRSQAVPISHLSEPLKEILNAKLPDADPNGYLSPEAMATLRMERIRQMLTQDRRELSAVEKEVVDSIANRSVFAHDPLADEEIKDSVGAKIADRVAAFGGSWTFIFVFFSLLLGWIAINAGLLLSRPFDPYPFILMNLILSCLAAIQAPVIMMSQNRQEAKDRIRSEHDYQVNLKAELEVRALHDKLDRLSGHQWDQLLEIQQMQIDILEELHGARAK